jgi:organic radical activating enzyme
MIQTKTKKQIWMETQSEVDKWDFVEIEHKNYISLDDLLDYICHLKIVYGKLGIGIEKLEREIKKLNEEKKNAF